MKRYLAKFRKGSGPMAMNAVDFYEEDGKIIRHEWSMGGESKEEVTTVPICLPDYKKIAI